MKPLDDLEFQRVAASRIRDAIDYIDDEIADNRERATRAYNGDIKDVLPDVPGRSRVVSYDVRDTVLQMLPSLLRIFTSTDRVVEFIPRDASDTEAAKQATDYCNFILRNDNDGFHVLHSCFKDALVRKAGIGKVWWEKVTKVEARRFEGINDETFATFVAEAEADENVEITEHEMQDNGHAFVVETKRKDGCTKIEALPPEEFIIDRRARGLHDASIVAHRCYKPVGELAAMGYDFDDMLELAGGDESFALNEEQRARQPTDLLNTDDDYADPAMRKVLYIEAYIRCDADGDGVIELRKVCCAGSAFKVLQQELVDDHPFFSFCPEPEPHTFFGLSIADTTYDIQLIRSQVMRLGLDSLSQVVTPRMLALQGAGLDMKQVLDNRVGSVVQATRPDALVPIQTDKGAPALAFEAYNVFGQVRQDRTGQNQASMGLTPDALQSVSRIAANELVQSSQQRVEMIARFFAEGGMKRMFSLILKCVTRYQDKERMIRLRNKFVPMDPRQWSPEMDMCVNVGLGTGNVEEKSFFFDKLLQIQQAIMQQAGPSNPWVDVEKIRATLEDAVEVTGKPFERYFLSQDEWAAKQQQMAAQPPQPPKDDPAMMLAQAEMAKSQASIQNQQAKTQFEAQRELIRDDRERDETEAKIIIECLSKGIDPQLVLAHMRQARVATPSQVA